VATVQDEKDSIELDDMFSRFQDQKELILLFETIYLAYTKGTWLETNSNPLK